MPQCSARVLRFAQVVDLTEFVESQREAAESADPRLRVAREREYLPPTVRGRGRSVDGYCTNPKPPAR